MNHPNRSERTKPYRGVNLGNWLVLERWMKPDLFQKTSAWDEYTLCLDLGPTLARRVIHHHRETFITERDFRWLSERGINSVRLPVGYWLFEPDGPFVGGVEYFEQALEWCEQYNLGCNIDLHGLFGHQSPEHHTGRSGYFRWYEEPDAQIRCLDLIERIAQSYRNYTCIHAFTLVNEPAEALPVPFLMSFYEQGYERVRRHMSADDVSVVIAAFTEARLPDFHRRLKEGQNVLTDIHPYPCFMDWREDQLNEFLAWGPQRQWPHLLLTGPEDLLVGEWSLGVPKSLVPVLKSMSSRQHGWAMKTYAYGQLIAYEQTGGWYFWSYKVENPDPNLTARWCFREAVQRGWLPDRFDDPSSPGVGSCSQEESLIVS
ncbi:MAG: beta-glucosidase [Phycisphaerae bacterium]|nr:MAG: beta-glucosidase [Phycisphaerae bacterium]